MAGFAVTRLRVSPGCVRAHLNTSLAVVRPPCARRSPVTRDLLYSLIRLSIDSPPARPGAGGRSRPVTKEVLSECQR
ncbi:hypothetical protein EVAR_79086_1 [Eumeta japonica]|uniref:Uncharacterized protein n=1 Tax=Eumeta variegata TaxID=151549 RepID=A0A4C1X1J9_EUMVA|nr:hypothetical protein EVAR_79086_1 [Eumeta japonica]